MPSPQRVAAPPPDLLIGIGRSRVERAHPDRARGDSDRSTLSLAETPHPCAARTPARHRERADGDGPRVDRGAVIAELLDALCGTSPAVVRKDADRALAAWAYEAPVPLPRSGLRRRFRGASITVQT